VNYWDWCMAGWGASCIDIDLSPWAGKSNIRIAFETYSNYGNPLMIDNVSISQYVGTEESGTEKEKLQVYPNPANGSFYVILPEKNNYTRLSLFNRMGQTVYATILSGRTNRIEINQENKLVPGIYFIKIRGSEETLTAKIIIY
ncbi:MAG: T9SS type A sorting domain-containing protein, partial [Chlorobi bacterium]|nr:T9SS type A sorting domain-containing protein [Chlorobiota bacterium]